MRAFQTCLKGFGPPGLLLESRWCIFLNKKNFTKAEREGGVWKEEKEGEEEKEQKQRVE